MSEIPILFLLLVASLLLTTLCIILARRRHWLDLPNSRSSHAVPTPKSGGVGFVLVFTAATCYAYARGYLSGTELFALLAVFPVALLGLLDDFHNLPIAVRIPTQMLCALLILWLLGGLPALPLFGVNLDFAWAGYLIGVMGLVWLINLYNFMDGIDGLAGLEACFACLAVAFFAWRQGQPEHVFLLLALVSTLLGFLILNLPRASIFMGDAGSNYLGLMLGTLGLITVASGLMNIWSWAILLGVFIVDSTLTLLTRYQRGERWFHAHRDHAYQHAAEASGSHGKVDLGLMLLNLLWLFPLSWVTLTYPDYGLLSTIIAYIPLIVLGKFYKAGVREGLGTRADKNASGEAASMKGYMK